MTNTFHKIIIAILIAMLVNSCGYKADPFYNKPSENKDSI